MAQRFIQVLFSWYYKVNETFFFVTNPFRSTNRKVGRSVRRRRRTTSLVQVKFDGCWEVKELSETIFNDRNGAAVAENIFILFSWKNSFKKPVVFIGADEKLAQKHMFSRLSVYRQKNSSQKQKNVSRKWNCVERRQTGCRKMFNRVNFYCITCDRWIKWLRWYRAKAKSRGKRWRLNWKGFSFWSIICKYTVNQWTAVIGASAQLRTYEATYTLENFKKRCQKRCFPRFFLPLKYKVPSN